MCIVLQYAGAKLNRDKLTALVQALFFFLLEVSFSLSSVVDLLTCCVIEPSTGLCISSR